MLASVIKDLEEVKASQSVERSINLLTNILASLKKCKTEVSLGTFDRFMKGYIHLLPNEKLFFGENGNINIEKATWFEVDVSNTESLIDISKVGFYTSQIHPKILFIYMFGNSDMYDNKWFLFPSAFAFALGCDFNDIPLNEVEHIKFMQDDTTKGQQGNILIMPLISSTKEYKMSLSLAMNMGVEKKKEWFYLSILNACLLRTPKFNKKPFRKIDKES